MAPADEALYELIYLALLELFEPSQVGEDALPDLSSFPYVFDDVKVGPPGAILVFVGLGPDKHSTCMIPQSFPFVKTQKHHTQHYTLGPSSDEHRMVKPFLPLDSRIQSEEVSKSGLAEKDRLKDPLWTMEMIKVDQIALGDKYRKLYPFLAHYSLLSSLCAL